MNIKAVSAINTKVDLLIVPLFEDGKIDKLLPKKLSDLKSELKKEKEFEGKTEQMFYVTPMSSKLPRKILFIGLGKEKKVTATKVRNATAASLKVMKHKKAKTAAFYMQAALQKFMQPLAEGFILADYNPAIYHTGESKKKQEKDAIKYIDIIGGSKGASALQKGKAVADAVNATRDLVNGPNNIVNQLTMAVEAKKISKVGGCRVTVLNKKQIEKLKMGALLGVNRGSEREAKLVIFDYKPSRLKSEAPILLVGKGITFDSGGYNLKPTPHISDMKKDMAGAAAVFGVFRLLKKLGVKRRVVGITPLTDNLVDAKAQKVNDIVTSYSGRTIEITNTDAEGRLVLCDALSYGIEKYKPSHVIDIATLTGACLVALGDRYCGMFGNNQRLIDKLTQAGEETDELGWQLPIHKDFHKRMKSKLADLQNADSSGLAGASTAAAFLEEFVGKTKWAHLDIAGVTWGKQPKTYDNETATGFGVRLLARYLEGLQ